MVPKDTLSAMIHRVLPQLAAVEQRTSTLDTVDLLFVPMMKRWHLSCTSAYRMRSLKTSRSRVLLVSNDKRLKRRVQACLTAIGLPTTLLMESHNDEDYLRALPKPLPQLIVLDDSTVQVGPALLEALHEYAPHCLIVYITSHHTAELERTVRQCGVLYYTENPPDAIVLQQVLASALRRSVRTGKFAA